MNLKELFEKQKELDEIIIEKKGLEGQDLLPNQILALQVEIGELANEWRGFKHWSNDQEPRNEKMLEEYVDCLHFVLSIGNEIGAFVEADWGIYLEFSLTDQFTATFQAVSVLSESLQYGHKVKMQEDYTILMYQIIGLGHALKLPWEQIEQEYKRKWEINKQRQGQLFAEKDKKSSSSISQ